MPSLDLEATGRIEKPLRKLPATGWDQRLTQLGINLHLPPGHRLLAAFGVDYAAMSWVERWRLLDMFIVLLVTAVAFRIAGVPLAVLTLVGLTLAHQEMPALTWAVLNLLIAIVLAQFAPDGTVASVRVGLARRELPDRRDAVRAVRAAAGAACVLPATRCRSAVTPFGGPRSADADHGRPKRRRVRAAEGYGRDDGTRCRRSGDQRRSRAPSRHAPKRRTRTGCPRRLRHLRPRCSVMPPTRCCRTARVCPAGSIRRTVCSGTDPSSQRRSCASSC